MACDYRTPKNVSFDFMACDHRTFTFSSCEGLEWRMKDKILENLTLVQSPDWGVYLPIRRFPDREINLPIGEKCRTA